MGSATIESEVRSTVNEFTADADKWGAAAGTALSRVPEAPTASDVVDVPETPDLAGFEPQPIDQDFTDPQISSIPVAFSPATVGNVNEFEAPDEPGERIDFDFNVAVSEPGPLQAIDWGEAPPVVVPDLEPAPEIEAPEAPVVGQTDLPVFAGVTLPEWDITMPVANLPVVDGQFDYISEEFASGDLDALMTSTLEIINGRMAVAQSVWDSIWSRVAGDLSRQGVAQKREARRAHAKLGWSMPGGTMLAKMDQAEQSINEQISLKAIEQGVQQALQTREDYWKAVETINQGVQILLQADTAHQERLLKSASAIVEAEVALYNAAVNVYNAKVQAASIQSQLKKLELESAMLPLEVYKGELEGAKIESEVDKNRVAMYTAQWEGQKTKVQAYAAWMEGIKSYVDAQRASVEAYGEEVKAKQTIVQAWATEWDAYTKKLEKPRLKIAAYQAETGLFGQQVQLHGQKVQGESARVNADVEIEKLKLQAASVSVQQIQAKVAAEDATMRAGIGLYSAQAQVYGSKVQGEVGRMESLAKVAQVQVQNAQLRVQAQAENVKAALGYWTAYQQNMTAWSNAAASVYATLGGSAYSAANISLGASSSVGYSYGMSYAQSLGRDYNVNVSASVDEASGLDLSSPIIPERIW